MTKRVENPKPGGRPSKKDTLNREGLKLCYTKGFTDKETALALQVTEDTLNNWKKADPEFFMSLKDWKLQADQAVERSLWNRANGYSCPETRAQWIDEGGGKGRWEYAEMTKHYPPDPTSMIFWLKNRQPAEWRDKQEIDVTDSRLVKAILEALPSDMADMVRAAISERVGPKRVGSG